MRDVISLVILIAMSSSFHAVAGTGASKAKEGYQSLNSYSEERGLQSNQDDVPIFDIDSAIDARTRVMADEKNIEKRVFTISRIYEKARHLLVTPEDYVRLLTPYTSISMGRANENFLALHLDEFFSLKPTIEQLRAFMGVPYYLGTAVKIKEYGLKQVKTAQNYLDIIQLDIPNPTNSYIVSILHFIRLNLQPFIEAQPKQEEVKNLLDHIMNLSHKNQPSAGRNVLMAVMSVDPGDFSHATDMVMTKIKHEFAKVWRDNPEALEWLWNYGNSILTEVGLQQIEIMKKESFPQLFINKNNI